MIIDFVGQYCEICGKPAAALVNDVLEIIPFNRKLTTRLEMELHILCEEHDRLPKIVKVLEDDRRSWDTT